MYARIYDKISGRYYKSLIYGIYYYKGGKKYIAADSLLNSFVIIEEENRDEFSCVNIISPERGEFTEYKGSWLRKYDFFKTHDNAMFLGYPDVFKNESLMQSLFVHGSCPINEAESILKDVPDRNEWNYIDTQEKAEEFVRVFSHFHDSSLYKLIYECDYNLRQINAFFDNGDWFGKAVLCFEGVEDFHIQPPDFKKWAQYWGASLCVTDKNVLWAEGDNITFDSLDKSMDYIIAISLKWRRSD